MAAKSGASHGLAAFLSLLVGGTLVDWLRPEFPVLFTYLSKAAVAVAACVERTFYVHLPARAFVMAFVAFMLSFLWGVLYHLKRHGSSD